jgi:hypothetical protein
MQINENENTEVWGFVVKEAEAYTFIGNCAGRVFWISQNHFLSLFPLCNNSVDTFDAKNSEWSILKCTQTENTVIFISLNIKHKCYVHRTGPKSPPLSCLHACHKKCVRVSTLMLLTVVLMFTSNCCKLLGLFSTRILQENLTEEVGMWDLEILMAMIPLKWSCSQKILWCHSLKRITLYYTADGVVQVETTRWR